MPEYRRAYVPGGTFFFTIVTQHRRPLFAQPANIERLRVALRTVMAERPFDLVGAVILPDHLHFVGRCLAETRITPGESGE
jgi:putative transposase